MRSSPTFLGVDLGTSGVRITVLNDNGDLAHTASIGYKVGLANCADWLNCCESLIRNIPTQLRRKLSACAVAGTSGTLLACDLKGRPLGNALTYSQSCPEQVRNLEKYFPDGGALGGSDSSFARALRLVNEYGPNILLRHQADWVNGWLTDDWRWGEEGNNLKLGWDLINKTWPQCFASLSWCKALPNIIASGKIISKIDRFRAQSLDLPQDLLLIAGTTDSNAAVLSVDVQEGDGVTVLGSTMVLKRFVKSPIEDTGITNHLIGGSWLCGGSSNAGAAVLKRFFTDEQLEEISRQINPEVESNLFYYPLLRKGERFPIHDPNKEPLLEPRPISDCLYLHGLLEGLALIELQGWERMKALGVPTPKRIITLGGGARNPQWRRIRERIVGIPIISSTSQPALGVAHIAFNVISKKK